jgi:hypothetical protein
MEESISYQILCFPAHSRYLVVLICFSHDSIMHGINGNFLFLDLRKEVRVHKLCKCRCCW